MNLSYCLIAVFYGLLVTLMMVPLNIKLSKKWEIVDKPKDRGIHKKIMPSAGGLSMVVPIISGILMIVAFLDYGEHEKQLLVMCFCGVLIAMLGVVDDKKNLSANYKLIVQIAVVTIMYLFGFKIDLLTNPFGESMGLGFLSYPMTLFWFLVVMNAFNLIDGIDGLSAGIAAIVVCVFITVGFNYKNYLIIFLSFLVLGTLLGFLKYNFYPARIFMGDTGALFIGFIVASLSITGGGQIKGITAMTILIPMISLCIPLFDTFLTVVRRAKEGRHIFWADKKHFHHKLLELGFSQRMIAILFYFMTFIFGLLAVGYSLSARKIMLLIFLLLTIMITALVYFLVKHLNEITLKRNNDVFNNIPDKEK